eukprot:g557.t1
MEKETSIKIYARMRPTRKPSGFSSMDEQGNLNFKLPVDKKKIGKLVIDNSRSEYYFKFNEIFGMAAKQDEVFEVVAKDCVLNCLDGINSTVFAYGQTGSGKTYTMTGGVDTYEERGIIPRALSLLFSELENRSDAQYTVHVSFLELYQDQGYDLLDADHGNSQYTLASRGKSTAGKESLKRVVVVEDGDGAIHLRNLSMHLVTREEDALNFLFLGDTNRAVNETAMNPNSSRSHCIFTVHLEARKAGSEVIQRAKLHLVDLAGSERVGKTGATGDVLREAKAINTSLHFLQMCIVALQKRSKLLYNKKEGSKDGQIDMHIPYRNCMLTSVLRDSLGGNCKTAMIATINMRIRQLGETLSTCRFAQTVAQVRNVAKRNRIIDPRLMLARREAELASMREELQLLKQGSEDRGVLTKTELRRIQSRVEAYMRSTEDTKVFTLGKITVNRVRAAFSVARTVMRSALSEAQDHANFAGSSKGEGNGAMLCKKCGIEIKRKTAWGGDDMEDKAPSKQTRRVSPKHNDGKAQSSHKVQNDFGLVRTVKITPNMGGDAKLAFEKFRVAHERWGGVLKNQKTLRSMVVAAKKCGTKVNDARSNIKKHTKELSDSRMRAALNPEASEQEALIENELLSSIKREKIVYRDGFAELKRFKKEIEKVKGFIESARMHVQEDFHRWYANITSGIVEDFSDEELTSVGTPKARAARDGCALLDAGLSSNSVRFRDSPTQKSDSDSDMKSFQEAKEQLRRWRQTQ